MDGLIAEPKSTPQETWVRPNGHAYDMAEVAPAQPEQPDISIPGMRENEQPLRKQIGVSKGRVTAEQYLARLDLVMKNFPQSLWPSTAVFSNKFKGQTAIIVGGGTSLAGSFHEMSEQIRTLGDNCKVFAPNRSHDWLINGHKDDQGRWLRHPIIPNFGVLTDPSEFVVDYQTIDKRVIYLLTPMLHHSVLLKYLREMASVFIWLPVYLNNGADIEIAKERYKGLAMHFVSGGSTVGLRMINICLAMGFDQVELYGFDSCYAPDPASDDTGYDFDGKLMRKADWEALFPSQDIADQYQRLTFADTLYAYDKPYTVHDVVDSTLRCREDGTKFRYRSNIMMAKQAMEFDEMLDHLPHMTVDGVPKQMRVNVHGDGLIPWLAWKASNGSKALISHADPLKMARKYGAGSYDYVEDKRL